VERVRQEYGLSERHACRLLGQWRGTQRYEPLQHNDEDALTRAIIALASQYGRYGYRRITALLRGAGWQVGKDRVQCIWRREGLKVPAKQRPRGRLWLENGSCVRLRPERAERHPKMLAILDTMCKEYVTLRTAKKNPTRMKTREVQIENVDTRLRTELDGAFLAAILYDYYRCGMTSPEIAAELGIKPPHMRQLIAKVWQVATAITGERPVRVSAYRAAERQARAAAGEKQERRRACGHVRTRSLRCSAK